MRPSVTTTICLGHVLDVLRTLPAESVHCVVTSPPYWGLRDYKLEPQVWGGDSACAHDWSEQRWYTEQSAAQSSSEAFSEAGEANADRLKQARWRTDATCRKCNAWRGSLGLEPTPDLYVVHLVDIFREVRRVLRKDGTIWLNLGDCYAAAGYSRQDNTGGAKREQGGKRRHSPIPIGLKPKDLVGTPWRVAFALQADGWWLRSDIIWSKPNPMPESVTDRPTKAHEYLFLLSKNATYFYDVDAIREPLASNPDSWGRHSLKDPGFAAVDPRPMFGPGRDGRDGTEWGNGQSRNKRTVWEIPTQPYPEAHFAVFPDELVHPCILAGCPEGGTVLDPFAGSGTTLMVAAKNGRNAIGIELQDDYVPMMRRRLADLETDLIYPVNIEVIRRFGSSNAP